MTSSTGGQGDDVELTMHEAARLLGISPAYLSRLVEEGHVSTHLMGTQRRLKASDVMTYRQARSTTAAKSGAGGG